MFPSSSRFSGIPSFRRGVRPTSTLTAFLGALAGLFGVDVASAQSPSVSSFCSGDGSGTACPCGNVGALGHGCANSFASSGALLSYQGDAFTSSDSLRLNVTGLPTATTVWLLQGAHGANNGLGAPFDDGLNCVGGSIVRLGQKSASGGSVSFGAGVPGDTLLSVHGLIPATGGTRCYQVHYRNSAAFCTSGVMNGSNALAVEWQPVSGMVDTGPASPTVIYLPDGLQEFQGWSWGWSQAQGTFMPMKQVFSVTLTDSTSPGTFTSSFRSVFDSDHHTSTHSSSFGIDAAFGKVKAAAHYANSSESTSSTISSGFQLVAEATFPPTIIDFTSATLTFTPEALSILTMPPESRLAAWHQAGFGDYIACGYGLRGAVVVQLSMTQSEKFSSRSSFLDFSAQYMTISASGQIGQAVHDALTNGQVSVTISTEGVGTPPGVPTADALGTTDGQIAWGNYLNSVAASARARTGVYLMSARSLVNGPAVDQPAWNGELASQAASEAQSALDTLNDACRWNRPSELQVFLNDRMIPPSNTLSFGQALFDARIAVGVALNGLETALSAYLTGNNAQDPARIQDLVTHTAQVRSARLALGSVLMQLRTMWQSLPAPTIALHENVVCTSATSWSHIAFDIDLDNIAAFTNFDSQSLYDWLTHRQGDIASLVVREDMEDAGIFNRPHFFPTELSNLSWDAPTTYTSGPQRGLKRIHLRLQCEWIPDDHWMHGTILDDFGRAVTAHIDIDNEN